MINNFTQSYNPKTFGILVLACRKAHRMSQAQLADVVGVSRNYISQIERGHGDNVSLSVFNKLCNVFGLTVVIAKVAS